MAQRHAAACQCYKNEVAVDASWKHQLGPASSEVSDGVF